MGGREELGDRRAGGQGNGGGREGGLSRLEWLQGEFGVWGTEEKRWGEEERGGLAKAEEGVEREVGQRGKR